MTEPAENAAQTVPLEEELDFVRRYLEVEQIRFRNRLGVRFEVESDARSALVPSFLLQPLVENAVLHAVAPYPSPRTVIVSAQGRSGVLFLEVPDDGPGLKAGERIDEGRGVGIRNIRERLERMHPDGHEFGVRHGRSGGAVARISFPLRRGPLDAERAEKLYLPTSELDRAGAGAQPPTDRAAATGAAR